MHASEEVLRSALAALRAGDADGYAKFVVDDLVVHVPGRSRLAGKLHGRGVVGRKVRELTGGELTVEPHDVLGSEQHAVGIYTMHVCWPDRSVQWRQVNVYRVRDGKITEAWLYPYEQQQFDAIFA